MKACDNSTRKIYISSNFILFIIFLIMFDTLFVEVVEQYAHITQSHTSHYMHKAL